MRSVERIIENWCKAAHYDRPIGYDIDYSDCVVTIYAERPGVLIGYQGKQVFKFKDILKEKFHREYQVKFQILDKVVNLDNKGDINVSQICPVCRGKGFVPNGFYDVSSNLGDIYKTTSATPETCRSCEGKGYIIVTPRLNHFIANTFNCSNCDNNDRMCYMSNPPQYKCTIDNTFHYTHDSCDKYKEQEPVYLYDASLLNNEDN